MSRALTAAERAAAKDHEWELDRVAWNLPQQQEPVGDSSEDGVSEPPDDLRQQPAVAVPGAAAVYPALVWPARVLFGLAATILLIGLASRMRDLWYLRKAPPRQSITLRKGAPSAPSAPE